MQEEKLYIEGVVTFSRASDSYGYQALDLIRLSDDKAVRKTELYSTMQKQLGILKMESLEATAKKELGRDVKKKLVDPTTQYGEEEHAYSIPRKRMLTLLWEGYERITGQLELYIVPAGPYQIGQILDTLPEGAIPLNEFLKKK